MRHKNMTFSIPEDLKTLLYSKIEKNKISRFISDSVRKSLKEKKEKDLDAAYEGANKDPSRLKTIREWTSLDDVSDLIDNEDWDWLKHSKQCCSNYKKVKSNPES